MQGIDVPNRKGAKECHPKKTNQPTYQADPYNMKFEDFSLVRSGFNFVPLILSLITVAELPSP